MISDKGVFYLWSQSMSEVRIQPLISISMSLSMAKMTIRTDQLINQGGEGAVFGVNTVSVDI